MRHLPLVAALAFALNGCQSAEPARLGVGYPGVPSPNVFDLVRQVLDTATTHGRVELLEWHLTGPNLSLHSSQAEAFAANRALVGVVGHAGSRDALLGAVIYNREEVPQVIPTGTSRELQRAGPWTFMMAPNDSVEGAFLANWALDSARVTRVAVMYLGDEYGIGIREGVRAGLAARDVSLVDEVLIPALNCVPSVPVNRDVMRLITQAMVRRARPEAVVLAAADNNGWCLTEVLHAVDDSLWVLGADGFNASSPMLSRRTPHNASRVRSVAFWVPDTSPASGSFEARYREVNRLSPDGGSAMMYDAFMVLRQAIAEAGPDRRDIRDWLASLGTTRPPYEGVTGPVYFHQPRAELLRMIAPLGESASSPGASPE